MIVDTGFQCLTRWGMPGGMISYRHDIGAWLNAAEGHAPRGGLGLARAALRAGRGDDALMALEDLWI